MALWLRLTAHSYAREAGQQLDGLQSAQFCLSPEAVW